MFTTPRFVGLLAGFMLILAACSSSADETSSAGGADDIETEATSSPTDSASPVVTIPFDEISSNHIDPPTSFETSPAIGGDHFAFWHNCGFYTEELIEGAAVHSLEHGAIWITYGDSLPDDEVAELEALAGVNRRLLISPYDHSEPIVMSAWGAQQRGIDSASAPEVAAFIDAWVDNPELIEDGASCSGAVGIAPDDPLSLLDGTPVPDEFLS